MLNQNLKSRFSCDVKLYHDEIHIPTWYQDAIQCSTNLDESKSLSAAHLTRLTAQQKKDIGNGVENILLHQNHKGTNLCQTLESPNLKNRLLLSKCSTTKSWDRLLQNQVDLVSSSLKLSSSFQNSQHLRLSASTKRWPTTLPSSKLCNPYVDSILNQSNHLRSIKEDKSHHIHSATDKSKPQQFLDGWEQLDELYAGQRNEFLSSVCWNKVSSSPDVTFPSSEEFVSDYKNTSCVHLSKIQLVDVVSSSLIVSINFSKHDDGPSNTIFNLLQNIAASDPEFNLKVALYARQELNIRTTSNYLLACCACIPECRPYLKKYFSASIQLPSDWIDVAEKCVSLTPGKKSIPAALRKVLISKFSKFDEYQLAKYNKTSTSKKKKKLIKKSEATEEKQSTGLSETENEVATTEVDDDVKEEEKREASQRFTLKQLISLLHITQPAYNVMCLLGKKYPDSVDSFYKSGLDGSWDSTLAGKRMKLKIPNTWETQLSAKGNNAKTWHGLLDDKAVPYMATLRNIRNMIKAGIDQKHHNTVIRFLTNKKAVMQSRQFPFRFFSAYEVLDEMEGELAKQRLYKEKGVTEFLSANLLLAHKNNKRKFGEKKSDELRLIDSIKHRLHKKYDENFKYDEEILKRYRKALDTAIEVAAQYNVAPIKGRTLILCDVSGRTNVPCMGAAKAAGKRSVRDVAILLALMCAHSCEAYTFVVFSSDEKWKPMKIEKGGILSNLKSVLAYAECISENAQDPVSYISSEYLSEILIERQSYDSCLLLAMGLPDSDQTLLSNFLERYRHQVNKDLMHYEIDLSGRKPKLQQSNEASTSKNVKISGFSNQILRYVAEGGVELQISHIDAIDKLRNLPQLDSDLPPPLAQVQPLPARTKVESFQTIKIFISSTLKDMRGERDILVNYVFPELRRRAAMRNVVVTECDFRWGIPAAGKNQKKTVGICLDEIRKCQLFIGLVGDRYGWIPKQVDLPTDRSWNDLLGKSITEIEMHEGGLSDSTSKENKAFFYIRSSQKPPPKFKKYFAESVAKQRKLEALKKKIANTPGLTVHSDYSFAWEESANGKPAAGSLQDFAEKVIDNLWSAISALSVTDDVDSGGSVDDVVEKAIAVHQQIAEQNSTTFVGQKLLLQKCVTTISTKCGRSRDAGSGSLICLYGAEGSGKTALISAVSDSLSLTSPRSIVLQHFVGCSADQSDDVKFMLDCLSFQLCEFIDLEGVATSGETFEDSNSLFWYFVRMATKKFFFSVFVFIDEIDALSKSEYTDGLKWIPDVLPPAVALVVSCTEGKKNHKILVQQKSACMIKIPPLNVRDSGAVIRQILSEHSKTLDENYFNNQLQKLTLKQDSKNPLYLKLACDYARCFADFATLGKELDEMPGDLSGLIEHWMIKVEDHLNVRFGDLGRLSVAVTLSLIHCSPHGIDEDELHQILCLWSRSKYKRSIPRSCFCQILHFFQAFLSRISEKNSTKFLLERSLFVDVIRKRYFSGESADKVIKFCHKLIAVYHMTSLARPDHFVPIHVSLATLPFHLSKCDEGLLMKLLSDFNFMETKCMTGNAANLLNDYSLLGSIKMYKKSTDWSSLWDLYFCLSSSFHLIDRHPSLLYQVAVSQELMSHANVAVSDKLVDIGEGSDDPDLVLFESCTRQGTNDLCLRTLNDLKSADPCCLHVSPKGDKVACGTSSGLVVVFSAGSGKRLHVMNGDVGVSKLIYVINDLLISAHVNGKLMIWNDESGIRIATVNAHRKLVTDMTWNSTLKYLACVSRDRQASIWQMAVNVESGANPIGKAPFSMLSLDDVIPNCVDFHPSQLKFAVGLWDGSIRVWEISSGKRVAIMRGSPTSITTVQYSTCGTYIYSSSLNSIGVNIWSASSGTMIGLLGNKYVINCVDVIPGRNCLAAAGSHVGNRNDATITVWNGSLGKQVGIFVCDEEDVGQALCCAFNEAKTRIAVGYHKSRLAVYDVEMRRLSHTWKSLHTGPVGCLCWIVPKVASSKPQSDFASEFIVTGSNDNLLKVVSLTNHQVVATCSGHSGAISALASCQVCIASASDDFSIMLWSVSTVCNAHGSIVSPSYVLRVHEAAPTCLSFNSSGEKFVSGGKDKKLLYWNVPEDMKASQLEHKVHRMINNAHRDWVTACSYSDKSDHVVTGSNDCSVRIWDGSNKLHDLRGHQGFITSVAYQVGCVLSTDATGLVRLWSHHGVEISTIDCRTRVNCAALAVSLKKPREDKLPEMEQTDWAAQVDYEEWQDAHESKVLSSKPGKKLSLEDVEFMHIAVAHDDGTAKLWAPLQTEELVTLSGHTGPITSLSSTLSSLFSCSTDGSIKSWDVSEQLQTSTSLLRHDAELTHLTVSGTFLFSACAAGQLKIWLLRGYLGNPSLLQVDKAHEARVSGIVVTKSLESASRAQIIFATSSFDGFIRMWKLSRDGDGTKLISLDELTVGRPINLLSRHKESLVVGTTDGDLISFSFSEEKGFENRKEMCKDCDSWFAFHVTCPSDVFVTNKGKTLEGDDIFHLDKDIYLCATTSISCMDQDEIVAAGDNQGHLLLPLIDFKQRIHRDRITSILNFDDYVLTTSFDRTIKVWRKKNMKQVGHFMASSSITCARMHVPTGTLICGFIGGDFQLFRFKQLLQDV